MSYAPWKDRLAILVLIAAGGGGCGSDAQPFAVQFAATVNGAAVSCAKRNSGAWADRAELDRNQRSAVLREQPAVQKQRWRLRRTDAG